MPANKDGDGGWKAFIWNSEKGEFLGRTGCSWFKIFAFYVIFYGCLAGIFIGTIQAMLLTLSDYKPTYQDRVAPPGLSHTPCSEKSEVSFDLKDESTYKDYIASMNKLLEPYDDDKQTEPLNFEDCPESPSDYKDRGELESDIGNRKACRFKRSWLGACSGTQDKAYGFKDGVPCFLVKLNRIVNFKPRPLANASTPDAIRSRSKPFLIPVVCSSKREEDAGLIQEIKYFGFDGGFPLQYYPYYGKLLHPQYLQPLVAIQMNVTQNEEVRVECKVYGANINYSEKDRYQGRFDFKLSIKS